jgi:uncharacterized protein (TIGR02246 family)
MFAISLIALLSVCVSPFEISSAKSILPSDSAAVENEIRDAISQRLSALQHGDGKAYVSFFAPDCQATSDDGKVIKPRDIAEEWSGNAHSGIVHHGSDVLDLQVRAYGEIAVAAFRVEDDEDWAGQTLRGATRITDVFAHRGGRWLLIAHQETAIPNERRLAVKIDASVLDAYVGEYALTPTYIVKVKREGDKLMDLWPGDAAYVEDVPVDQATFVARGEAGEIIYVKDERGKVTHFILRTAGGDLIARKSK